MCGIFGFAFQQHAPMEARQMRSLLVSLIELSESRGKEAAGLALSNDRELTVYKEARRGKAFLQTNTFQRLTDEAFSRDALARAPIGCIGHTRLVTNGSMEHPENNQPIIRGNMVGVHNGIIVNDAELFATHELERTCEVDTEALLALIEAFRAKGESIASAVSRAFAQIRGTASVAIFFRDVPIVVLASNNGSLYTLSSTKGVVFASERYILEQIVHTYGHLLEVSAEEIRHREPQSGWIFHLTDGSGRHFSFGEEHQIEDVPQRKNPLTLHVLRSEWKRTSSNPQKRFTSGDLKVCLQLHEENKKNIAQLRRCTRCILPETMPFITFDTEGTCNFCQHHTKHMHAGEEALLKEVEAFRSDGHTPDCLFPLSGGRDSSYGLHYVKTVLNLNPIAYSYDWGMLTDLGRRNQARICGALGVEHLLISADIEKKRRHIKQNVTAWLQRPDLGTVPLFMAGDKQYFYYLNLLKKKTRTGLSIYCENPLEQTNFKYGFCGVSPKFDQEHVYRIGLKKKLTLAFYYAKHYARNPRLLNASLTDTAGAFFSTYVLPHNYVYLFRYIPWDEETINRTLIEQYDWETADDTTTTWRIGDGTAAFYNYIYYTVAGFTENDTFRSNQIREGALSRREAMTLVERENQPRFPSLEWYGNTIGIDIFQALQVIQAMPKRY